MVNREFYVFDTVGIENWNHVESHNNPADLASRGMVARELTFGERDLLG